MRNNELKLSRSRTETDFLLKRQIPNLGRMYMDLYFPFRTISNYSKSIISSAIFRYLIGLFVIEALTIFYGIIVFLLIYLSYIPTVRVERYLDLTFDTNCSSHSQDPSVLCSFPNAEFSLSKNGFSSLSFGHPYTLLLNMWMPDSSQNRRAGMGIITLELYTHNRTLVQKFRKPFSAPYHSPEVRLINNLLFSPLYIFGKLKEEYEIKIEMCPNFESDVSQPIMEGLVVLESYHFIWSGLQLGIYAHLTGLRKWLYYYPQLSCLFCVGFLTLSINLIYLSIIIIYFIWILLFKFQPVVKSESDLSKADVNEDDNDDLITNIKSEDDNDTK